jgi:hypothetical protein
MSTTATDPAGSRRRRLLAVAVAIWLLAALVTWLLWPRAATAPLLPPAAQAVAPGTALTSKVCHTQTSTPFVPTSISVEHVTSGSPVVALPRDGNNVPGAISLSAPDAKTAFAWDKVTVKPGTSHGNVLLNTHTWPDDSSMGNHLLDHLQVGGGVVLRGAHGEEMCYRVTKRFIIVAADGSKAYYNQKGTPQVAIIVCSPPRLGPGDWYHRTIWFASPLGTPKADAVTSS